MTRPHRLFLVLVFLAGEAHAQGSAECVKASEAGLGARDGGKLRAARKHFVACAADTCPNPLRTDCARWLDEVDASIPTVALGAKDAQGKDVFDVKVFCDGEPVVGHEQGRAVALDPGPHLLRFERSSGERVDERVLLRVGERNRPITVKFDAASAAATSPKSTSEKDTSTRGSGGGVPTASIVLGVLGLAALGGFTYFAISGGDERDRLHTTCSPRCTDGDVSDLRTRYVVGDIALGVGIVSLSVAALLYLTQR